MDAKAIVFHFGALGDLLISLPCIRFIKSVGYKVTLVASPPQSLLLKELMEVDEVIDASSSFLSNIYTSKGVKILDNYARIFIFSKSHNPELLKILKDRHIYPDLIHTYPLKEISNYIYQFVQILKTFSIKFDKDLRVSDFLKNYYSYFRPFNGEIKDNIKSYSYIISVHLGSGSEVKNLPLSKLDRFIKVIDGLYKPKWFLITGPAESKEKREFVRKILSDIKNRAEHLDSISLLSLLRYLKSSSLFIGNDSGISHLAAFCGLNSILCFGPTNPKIWSPPFKWVRVILSKKKCAPCMDYHNCKEKDCMKNISLEELILVTQEFLG